MQVLLRIAVDQSSAERVRYVHRFQMQGLRIKGMRRKVETLISDPDMLLPQPHVEQ